MIIKLPVCKDENNNPVIDPEKKYSDNGYIPDFEYIKEYIERLRHKIYERLYKIIAIWG